MDIEQRLEKLRQRIGEARGNPFANLLKTIELRSEFEALCTELVKGISLTKHSISSLLLLEILELARATDIARKFERVASIGPHKRPPWSNRNVGFRPSETAKSDSNLAAMTLRKLLPASIRAVINPSRLPGDDWVELRHLNSDSNQAVRLNLSKMLILHLGFVGDSLVVALDANLDTFVYGESACNEDQRLQGKYFSDYGYNAASLDPNKLIYGPVVRPGIRKECLRLAEEAEKQFSISNRDVHRRFFNKLIEDMDLLFDFKSLNSSIQRWAEHESYDVCDICLVVIPDESLYLLPLGFLGASRGVPLVTRLGGVVSSLSLLTFKWALKDYHWTTIPNQEETGPRCSVFAASNLGGLQLEDEITRIREGFGDDLTHCFGPDATLAEFAQHYSSGEVCWFSGHGLFDGNRHIEIGGRVMPMPISGPSFHDGVLTNLDLIATSNWNFKPLWLTVMNCCLLARSLLVGPNPLGFMSALHSAGSISTVAALWPIWDDSAVRFAGHLSREIPNHYGNDAYPRAAALREAIRGCLSDGSELSDVAAYSLWGVP